MTPQATFWDKVAPKYAKTPIADQAAYEYTLGRTRSYLTPNDRVLELGCGTGSTALLLASNVKEITAIDMSPGMLAIARQKAATAGVKNLSFEVGADVPRQGRYDVVMGYSLFHLVPDMEQRFAQIHALLPKGGYFITKTACLGQGGGGMGGALKSLAIRIAIPVMQMIGKAPYVRSFSVKELQNAVTAAGFEIVESGNHPKGPPPAHYIVARKV
ncbi:MAG: methyltransferase domain-containing protein [Albidovulum sp.]